MSAPTPRPWRLWNPREGEGNLAIEHLPPAWVGIESMHGVGALGQAVAAGFGPANAALIIRAVNAHAALVDALYEVLAAHQRGGPHPEDSCSNCTLARAALALAQEKP